MNLLKIQPEQLSTDYDGNWHWQLATDEFTVPRGNKGYVYRNSELFLGGNFSQIDVFQLFEQKNFMNCQEHVVFHIFCKQFEDKIFMNGRRGLICEIHKNYSLQKTCYMVVTVSEHYCQ